MSKLNKQINANKGAGPHSQAEKKKRSSRPVRKPWLS